MHFFIIFPWIVFVILSVYVFISWKNPKFDDTYRKPIRKTWYTMIVFGALVIWSSHPRSIFDDWKNYLIVGVIAIAVDAFIILGLQIKRVGNSELTTATKQVAVNDALIKEYREKVMNLIRLLQEDGLLQYYSSTEDYVNNVAILIKQYFDKSDIHGEIVRYQTEDEKNDALKEYCNLNTTLVKSRLKNNEAYFKDKLALCPLVLFQETYLVKLSSKNDISDMDVLILNLLIITYDLQVQENQQGGENAHGQQ